MDGRFYVCPKWGSELANPNIDEALYIGEAKAQKYPAALLMPPSKEGQFEYRNEPNSSGHTDIYTIKLLFVAGTTNTGQNQPQQPNQIERSTHTIPETWHDMDRCATDFIAVLREVILPSTGNIMIWDTVTPKITPVTDLGSDKVSGVMLYFKLALFSGCTVEDYPDDWITSIIIPDQIDSHPIHKM